MRRKEIAHRVFSLLNELIKEPKTPLFHTDAFTLLIAVLLSAQCTDERVNKVTPRLFAKASTPEKMAHLSVETIQESIRPCGLSSRKATSIKRLSKMLVDRFKGKVPSSLEELESLPGVGHKTASVILAQAFNIPAFPVDTHIFRSARRWGLSKKKTVQGVEEDLKKLFPKESWIRIHLQMILYARKFCPAKKHKIKDCPICCMVQTVEDKNI